MDFIMHSTNARFFEGKPRKPATRRVEQRKNVGRLYN